jgi:hypothetical protein
MVLAIAERARIVQPTDPQGAELRIVPILGPSHDQPAYRLLDAETLSRVRVTEVSESGSVPELLVENQLDVRVLLMDGQELVGAKQNRILNADVLVPASSKLKIPVSCVEQGRWRHISDTFAAGRSASHRTRAGKQERVRASLKAIGKHDANQAAVWSEVEQSLAVSGAVSPTSALADAYTRREADLRQLRESLVLPGDAVGLAVFHGAAFQGLDLFDRHTSLRYFWDSLIDSYAIDWLGRPPTIPADAGAADAVRQTLERSAAAKWERFPSPGEGVDYRLDDDALSGSALVWEERTLLHLQLFPRQPAGNSSAARAQRPRIHRRYGTRHG